MLCGRIACNIFRFGLVPKCFPVCDNIVDVDNPTDTTSRVSSFSGDTFCPVGIERLQQAAKPSHVSARQSDVWGQLSRTGFRGG